MINPIDPHGPVQHDPPSRAARPGGHGDPSSFEDLLSQHSSSADDDHANSTRSASHRPVHAKGVKNSSASSHAPSTDSTGVPSPAQPDPRLLTPAITLSTHWSPPVVPPDDDAPPPIETDVPGAPVVASEPAPVGPARKDGLSAPAGPLPVNDPTALPVAGLNTAPADLAPATKTVPTERAQPPQAGTDADATPLVGDSRLVASAMPGRSPGAAPAPAETSRSSGRDAANTAGSVSPEDRAARHPEAEKLQVVVNEQLTRRQESDGTPVAKEDAVLNATLTNNETDAETSAPPRRSGTVAPGPTAAGRPGIGSSHQNGEVLMGMAVSGATGPSAAGPQVTGTATPEPTAARQVVRVETLLQNALSAGENLRPNGTGQMELRVRLGGGHEDVTVRMQVANDRMQVTFQTNSPELRKALEHGWEQFSADASQSSTLSMAEPRFETRQFHPAAQNAQGDAPSFSSGQQNSRRQEDSPAFAEDRGLSGASPRVGVTANTPVTPADGQPADQRWSRWA